MAGCVTGRRTVPLPIPSVGGTGSTGKGKMAIGSVSDNRRFENKPSSPSTPSIKGDVNSLTAAQRASFIGRQRNTWGKAIGDIALPEGESVETRVRELVRSAFATRGYTVTTELGGAATVDVVIDEFWAWFTPGFATVAFEARVGCTVTLRRGGAATEFTIQGQGKNLGQVARNANWQLAYTRAFQDFLQKLDAELESHGF